MSTYGYIRVSSKDQNPDRQYEAMTNSGVDKANIFVDKVSGKNFERPQYKKMMRKLRKGDEVIILSIAVIDMPLLNTKSERNGLTGIFIADLVLQILAYVAETERSFIKKRQAEGIAVAKKKGVRFGAERMELGDELETYCYLWIDGMITLDEGAAKFGVSQSTFYRRCMEVRNRVDMTSCQE